MSERFRDRNIYEVPLETIAEEIEAGQNGLPMRVIGEFATRSAAGDDVDEETRALIADGLADSQAGRTSYLGDFSTARRSHKGAHRVRGSKYVKAQRREMERRQNHDMTPTDLANLAMKLISAEGIEKFLPKRGDFELRH